MSDRELFEVSWYCSIVNEFTFLDFAQEGYEGEGLQRTRFQVFYFLSVHTVTATDNASSVTTMSVTLLSLQNLLVCENRANSLTI